MSNYEYTKKWRKRNPEKLKEQRRRYREKHRIELKEQQRRYREKHRIELNKKQSIYDRKRAEKRFNDNIEELAKYIEENGF